MGNLIEQLKDFEVRRKIEELKERWNLKTPQQKWLFLWNTFGTITELAGVRIFSDMKNSWYSYLGAALGVVYTTLVLYTMWFYFVQGEFLKGMECTYTAGIVTLIITVYWKTVGPQRFRLNKLLIFGGKYIHKNDKKASRYNTLCEKMIEDLVKNVVILGSAIIISHSLVGLVPIYFIMFQNIHVTVTGTEIPFFDPDSNVGYAINLGIQYIFGIISMVTLIVIQFGLNASYNNIIMCPEIIHLELDNLENELNTTGMNFSARIHLRNILMKIQDYYRYAKEIGELFYLELLEGPFFCAYSISFSIFALFIHEFPPGYGLVVGNYFLLLLYCYLGETIKGKKELIATNIFNFEWYLLSPKCQRELAYGICMVQNIPTLKIGPFAELKLEASTNLTRGIFRFVMILRNIYN